MKNIDWLIALGASGREMLRDMAREGDETNTGRPWCIAFTDEDGDCPEHGCCGDCRWNWLEAEHEDTADAVSALGAAVGPLPAFDRVHAELCAHCDAGTDTALVSDLSEYSEYYGRVTVSDVVEALRLLEAERA